MSDKLGIRDIHPDPYPPLITNPSICTRHRSCLLCPQLERLLEMQEKLLPTFPTRRWTFPQLSYSHAGKGHTKYVRPEDVPEVTQEIENYRRFRDLTRKVGSAGDRVGNAQAR